MIIYNRDVYAGEILGKLLSVRDRPHDWDGCGSPSARPDAYALADTLCREFIPPADVRIPDSVFYLVRVGRDGSINIDFENRLNARKLHIAILDGRLVRVVRFISALSHLSQTVSRTEIEAIQINPFEEFFRWLVEPLTSHEKRRMK